MRKLYFILVIAAIYGRPSLAQSIMTLREITEGGKIYDVIPLKENDKVIKCPNVDINSSIKIVVDKNKIKDLAAQYSGKSIEIPFEQMKVIADVLAIREKLIKEIKIDSKSDLASRQKALIDFSKNVSQLLSFVSKLPADNSLRIKANNIFSKGISAADGYFEFFNVLQSEIDNVKLEYQKISDADKIYFRLGGFINKNHVHIEGYDTYADGEYYKVPRFVTAIPADEKNKFDQYKALAEQANKDAGQAFKSQLKVTLDTILQNFKETFEKKIAVSFSQFKDGVDSINGITEDIKDNIQKAQNEVIQLETSIKSYIEVIEKTDDSNYFQNLENGIQTLAQAVLQFQQNIQSIIVDLDTTIPSSVNVVYKNFKDGYLSGKETTISMINDIKNFFNSQIGLNIDVTEKIGESLLKLDDEVKKIPLDNIPNETTLDLLYSGYRKDGDKLYLKAVLGRESLDKDGKEISEEQTIEFTTIGIYEIRFHGSIKAVLLFVDNTSASFQGKKDFQLDPSYSVLFKWGSRKSSNYNEFVEFGFGVNMATLDFNNDNTPEIGIGLVVSAFKDYLQFGYGRNMGVDQNYWFFGIRLPFIGVNLNGNPKVLADD